MVGLWYALASAATFGLSGPMAKAMLEAGWSPAATVMVRVGGAALVLAVPAARAWSRGPRISRSSLRTMLLFGTFAVAGVQLAFFSAVRTLDVGVALLVEYLGVVVVVGYVWARTRVRPSREVIGGVALALLGLVLVLDLTGVSIPDPVGLAWALVAAFGLASYFIICGEAEDDLPPLVLTAGGLGIGAVVLALAGLAHVVPLTFTANDASIGGTTTSIWVPLATMILVPTVLAYVTGAAAARRLGARLASVTGLIEVLFGVLFAWLLLDQLPGPMQFAGGVLIIAGVIVIRRYEGSFVPSEQTHAQQSSRVLVEGDHVGAPMSLGELGDQRVREVGSR